MAASHAPIDIFRQHGGKVECARALFPDAPPSWIDLSTGVSPWAYPYDALASEVFARLPGPEALAKLEAAAAECFNVANAAQVVALPGSDVGLRIMGSLFSGKKGAVVRPGYSGHVLAWAGSAINRIAVDGIEDATRDHDTIVLANPNNPDGRLLTRERLFAVAASLAARGGTLVVDEAFADAAPTESLCDRAGDALIVFRSFGKFFGLSGLRLGFMIGGAGHAERFRHALGDWPVNGPAIAIGTAAYLDLDWQRMQKQRLSLAAARLDSLLLRAGMTLLGGTSLFRLARCGNADAWFRHLAGHSILTRPFTDDGSLLRFGLPGEESHWQRLAAALNPRHLS